MYDPACETLAKHFLVDEAGVRIINPKIIAALAQHIQTEIEVWLEYELPVLLGVAPSGETPTGQEGTPP